MLNEKKRAPSKPPAMPGFPQSHGSSWKVAYADFVTAMMAFFLLMWILNMVPPETQKKLEQYFKEPKPPQGAMFSPNPDEPPRDAALNRDDAMRYAIAVRFRKIITEDPLLKSSSGVSTDDVGVMLRIQNGMLFAPGSAELSKEAERLLADVVEVLKTYNVYLVIRGHADAAEAAKGHFASNWELSGARAAAAARRIIATGGIDPSRIRAVAYGDSRPLVPETATDAVSLNRRVEFYFHRPEVNDVRVLY